MALSGSQKTRAGGLHPYHAYAGFSAKIETQVTFKNIIYLSKENKEIILSKEIKTIYI